MQYNIFHNGDISQILREKRLNRVLTREVMGNAGAKQNRERKGSAEREKSACQGVEACKGWLPSG